MRSRSGAVALAAIATVALSACGGGADPTVADPAPAAPATSDGAAASEDDDAGEPGDAADANEGSDGSDGTTRAPSAAANADLLAWEAADLDGNVVTGADLAGGDVLLWMWAPWCSICNREAPAVAQVLAEFGDDVRFVGVAGRDTPDEHREFVARHGLDAMTTVVDEDGSLWAAYGVSYQPAWVFIDEDDGAQLVPGALGEEQLREMLATLVAT